MKRRLNIVLLLSAFLVSLPAAGQWYRNYDNGKLAVRDQKWQLAIDELSTAIREKPEARNNAKTHGLNFIDYCPYVYRGVAFFHANRLEDARRDFQTAARFGAVLEAKRDREAGDYYRRYEARIRESGQLQQLLRDGQGAFERGDYDTAERLFRQVQSLDDGNASARDYLRRIEQARGSAALASELAAGRQLLQTGDAAAALQTFRALQQQAPGNTELAGLIEQAEAQLQLEQDLTGAIDAFEAGQYVRARGLLDAVLRNHPGNDRATEYLQRTDAKLRELAQQQRDKTTPDESLAGNSSSPVRQEPETPAPRQTVAADPPEAKPETVRTERRSENGASAGQNAMSEGLRRAILAFYRGDFQQTIAGLRQIHDREKLPANLILGSAYASQYFLGGSTDQKLLNKAKACFATVKSLQPDYSLSGKRLSPRIVALFESVE